METGKLSEVMVCTDQGEIVAAADEQTLSESRMTTKRRLAPCPHVTRGPKLGLSWIPERSELMSLRERTTFLALRFLEAWLVPVLPRGAPRNRLRGFVDRAHARLHVRVHGDHHAP